VEVYSSKLKVGRLITQETCGTLAGEARQARGGHDVSCPYEEEPKKRVRKVFGARA